MADETLPSENAANEQMTQEGAKPSAPGPEPSAPKESARVPSSASMLYGERYHRASGQIFGIAGGGRSRAESAGRGRRSLPKKGLSRAASRGRSRPGQNTLQQNEEVHGIPLGRSDEIESVP